MVQVPDSFDPTKACIVTATSSGSRGVYGAIGSVGRMGPQARLRRRLHRQGHRQRPARPHDRCVGLIDGTRTDADRGRHRLASSRPTSATPKRAFNAAYAEPRRLQARAFAAEPREPTGAATRCRRCASPSTCSTRHVTAPPAPEGSKRIVIDRNTLVIASGISNGGAAALAAAEQDHAGLIDGVAITEPNAQPGDVPGSASCRARPSPDDRQAADRLLHVCESLPALRRARRPWPPRSPATPSCLLTPT